MTLETISNIVWKCSFCIQLSISDYFVLTFELAWCFDFSSHTRQYNWLSLCHFQCACWHAQSLPLPLLLTPTAPALRPHTSSFFWERSALEFQTAVAECHCMISSPCGSQNIFGDLSKNYFSKLYVIRFHQTQSSQSEISCQNHDCTASNWFLHQYMKKISSRNLVNFIKKLRCNYDFNSKNLTLSLQFKHWIS